MGVSPFDRTLAEDAGYVVHLGAPRFTARWSLNETEVQAPCEPRSYFDDDTGLAIYEVSLLDEFSADLDQWLLEAACAVAYSKGLICIVGEEESEH